MVKHPCFFYGTPINIYSENIVMLHIFVNLSFFTVQITSQEAILAFFKKIRQMIALIL